MVNSHKEHETSNIKINEHVLENVNIHNYIYAAIIFQIKRSKEDFG